MPRGKTDAKRKEWSQAEDKLLLEFYAKHSNEALLAILPGRTINSIASHAKVMRLQKNYDINTRTELTTLPSRAPQWTAKEDELIREHYTKGAWPDLLERLPTRTQEAIANRAKKLGVKRASKSWEPWEQQYLEAHYPDAETKDVALAIGRSATAVNRRAAETKVRKSKVYFDRKGAERGARRRGKPIERTGTPLVPGIKKIAKAPKHQSTGPAKTPYWKLPHNSEEYKQGLAAHLAGKQAVQILDQNNRLATVYRTPSPSSIR
ncbi:SANT/Myb-like DNA-binding domain-containing protein [Hymenobacter aerilatus]|uniref:SANT/Myb-like DNA-binding domain-containing protein n=1 Tax=Hymenobacter aerilatus TaxID=2932251 RepID=A0A8T9T200_9BACT|nr:SANT/Myb-like DNA-binding domain-containing protein [Hymenobacter aerilatus]UOR07204.1 SANT/Myb-like DNA-binding domain-containing protein [Hymenobacter aerilatus]